MRLSVFLVISLLVVTGSSVQAQERIPLPPPDPVQSGAVVGQPPTVPPDGGPASQPQPGIQFPPPGTTPQGPYGVPPGQPLPVQGPYGPYGPYPYPPLGVYPPPRIYPPPGAYGGELPPPPTFFPIHGDPAGNPGFWVGFEALVWWSKNQPVGVPLITTGPAAAGPNPGGLNVPGTVSLNQPLNYGAQGGFRFYGGGWFDAAHTWGLDGSIFVLGQNNASFGATDRSGTGSFVINEPVNGAPFSTLVSAPGIDSGNATVNSWSQLWGLDLNGMYNIYRSGGLSVTLLGGFRYLQLNEEVDITANSALFVPTTYTDNLGNVLAYAPPGSTITTVDQFSTHNSFYGGQIGARVEYMWNRWDFSATGLLAIGGTHESVNVNGFTNVYPINGQVVPLVGGNYATSQIGHYAQDRFAVAPEMRLYVGYQFTPTIRANIGYDLLFLSSVARPGEQIDNTYDGQTHPLVPMKTSTFWTQGLNLNVQFNF